MAEVGGTGAPIGEVGTHGDVASVSSDGALEEAPGIDSDATSGTDDGTSSTDDGELAADDGASDDTLESPDSGSEDAIAVADAVVVRGPTRVLLRTAGDYVIMAKTTVTNAPPSRITGDLGLSPGKSAAYTGFAPTGGGTSWTSTQVTGRLFAADNDAPTPATMTLAVSDMERAYTDAEGRPNPTFTDVAGGALDGSLLPPGLYRWSSAVTIASDITISGGPDDTWIFQVTGAVTMAAATSMHLGGGARARNVVWQVAGAVGLGAGAHAEGTFLSKTAISLAAGASVNGRLFAQTAVTLATNDVSAPP